MSDASFWAFMSFYAPIVILTAILGAWLGAHHE